MSSKNARVAAIALLLTACGSYPRDIEGTSERVRREGMMRVAFAELDTRQTTIAQRYAKLVAKRAGARLQERTAGATEALMMQLEQGKLDLVIANVATDTPWLGRVAVVEPLSKVRRANGKITLSPVARSGENQWIALLEREARDLETAR